jgi:hypothetical protein
VSLQSDFCCHFISNRLKFVLAAAKVIKKLNPQYIRADYFFIFVPPAFYYVDLRRYRKIYEKIYFIRNALDTPACGRGKRPWTDV